MMTLTLSYKAFYHIYSKDATTILYYLILVKTSIVQIYQIISYGYLDDSIQLNSRIYTNYL